MRLSSFKLEISSLTEVSSHLQINNFVTLLGRKLNAKRNVVMVTENESCMLFLGLFLPFIASVTILSMIEEFHDLKKN